MPDQIQKCQDCQHKGVYGIDRWEYWHCKMAPDNPYVGAKTSIDYKFCCDVRKTTPICPNFTPKKSWRQKLRQFFS